MFKVLGRGREATNRVVDVTGAWDGGFVPATAHGVTGFVAGTKVATQHGWQDVMTIKEGDVVLTFDAGLQPVIEVRTNLAWEGEFFCPEHLWPMHIPAGALGNREDMTIMPDQTVLIESDVAEEVFGDAFTMIKAASLEGYRGITQDRQMNLFKVVTLVFENEEVIFANSGALFHCPGIEGDLGEDSDYTVLDEDQAELLIDTLDALDCDATDFANPSMVA